jgi:hypothetical protein
VVALISYAAGLGLYMNARRPDETEAVGSALVTFSLILMALLSLSGLVWGTCAPVPDRPRRILLASLVWFLLALLAGILCPAKGYA